MEDKDLRNYHKGLLESLIFLSSEPVKLSQLAETIKLEKSKVRDILDELILDYEERDSGILLKEIAGGYTFSTNYKYHDVLGNIFKERRRETLTKGTLEVLAIIAYKQPLTLSEIEEIRGAASRSMVTNLLSKKLIKIVGYKELPGRPGLYGTTNEFLMHFGLNKLSDLPTPVEVKELKFESIDDLATEYSKVVEKQEEVEINIVPDDIKINPEQSTNSTDVQNAETNLPIENQSLDNPTDVPNIETNLSKENQSLDNPTDVPNAETNLSIENQSLDNPTDVPNAETNLPIENQSLDNPTDVSNIETNLPKENQSLDNPTDVPNIETNLPKENQSLEKNNAQEKEILIQNLENTKSKETEPTINHPSNSNPTNLQS